MRRGLWLLLLLPLGLLVEGFAGLGSAQTTTPTLSPCSVGAGANQPVTASLAPKPAEQAALYMVSARYVGSGASFTSYVVSQKSSQRFLTVARSSDSATVWKELIHPLGLVRGFGPHGLLGAVGETLTLTLPAEVGLTGHLCLIGRSVAP